MESNNLTPECSLLIMILSGLPSPQRRLARGHSVSLTGRIYTATQRQLSLTATFFQGPCYLFLCSSISTTFCDKFTEWLSLFSFRNFSPLICPPPVFMLSPIYSICRRRSKCCYLEPKMLHFLVDTQKCRILKFKIVYILTRAESFQSD